MNQNQAEQLQAERRKSENTFDITQYEHVPRRYYGRIFFATLIIVALAGLARAFANGQIEWSYIGQFLTSEAILWGLLNTIVMSILAMILGVIIGVITAIMRMSANPILRYVAITYTWLFRGTPLILQLLLWFNLALIFPVIGIPGVMEIDTVSLMTPFVAALLGLSINQGAYTAEVVRAGLLSVDTGQYEAAKSIGMPRLQALRRVILPQAMRVIIPPVGNEFISMVKMTSLASVIQYSELLHLVPGGSHRPVVWPKPTGAAFCARRR
jgi:polar amino acid transport system permease protein